MLLKHPKSAATLADAVWIDLLEPTDAERAQVEREAGLRLPTHDAIDEIESSSRAYAEDETLYFSTPVLQGKDCLNDTVTPVGFVLTADRLVTLRFRPVTAIDEVAAAQRSGTPRQLFLTLLDMIIAHAADALEHASAELDRISQSAFRTDRSQGMKVAHASAALHAALSKLGRIGGGISHIRDTLLGVGRIATFLHEEKTNRRPAEAARLKAIRTDIESLNDYQVHLSNKVQFLLDATLGFINIQQNDIVKALTIVSVVGVPPVLIVGIYGMNFKFMPELQWALGYPYAMALIVASTLAPIAWFKWRGWM